MDGARAERLGVSSKEQWRWFTVLKGNRYIVLVFRLLPLATGWLWGGCCHRGGEKSLVLFGNLSIGGTGRREKKAAGT